MKLKIHLKLIALFAFSVLIVLAMALVLSQSTSATTNWPQNEDEPPQPGPDFTNVTFDPEGGPLNDYYGKPMVWVVNSTDNLSYSGLSEDDPPLPGELNLFMINDIHIDTGGVLTLENVRLTFTHNDTTFGNYGIVEDGTFVGKNLSIEHDIIIDGDVVIDTDTTYSNLANETRILILGNLTIESGATLTLDDVSVSTDAGDDIGKVMIESGGSLVMENGALLESLSTFTEDVLIYTLDAQGTLDVTDSEIRNHGILLVRSDASIVDSTVSSSDNSPFTTITIMGDGITPTIQGTNIESSNDMGVGIYVGDGTAPSITGNSFNASAPDGFKGGNPILVEGVDCAPDIDDNYFGGGNNEIHSFGIKTIGCLPTGGGDPLEDANTFDADNGKRHVEVYWYITVTVEDNGGKGLPGVDVNCLEQDSNYDVDGMTNDTGVVVFELLDYKVQKSGTLDYGTCDITASKEDEMDIEEDVDVDGNTAKTLVLNIIAYDYWPYLGGEQFTSLPMTLGKPYMMDFVINNMGYADDGIVTVEIYIDDIMAGTDDILVDTEILAVNDFEIVVPAGAAKESEVEVYLVNVDDDNPLNNSATVDDVQINSAPVVTITTPVENDKVMTDVVLEGTYMDDDEGVNASRTVTEIMVRVDGGDWDATDLNMDDGDWDYIWSTMDTDNDEYVIEVAAWDGLNIMSEIAEVTVVVENLPTISIEAIEGELGEGEDVITVPHLINGEVDTSKKITGEAEMSTYSGYDLMRVTITIKHLDGETIVDEKNATDTSDGDWTNWEYTWTGEDGSINNLADGEYEIMATVHDEFGFTASETYGIMVMADNVDTDPVVTITTEDPLELVEVTNTIVGSVTDDFIYDDWFEIVYKVGTDGTEEDLDVDEDGDWAIVIMQSDLAAGESDTVFIKAFDGQAWSSEVSIGITRPSVSLDLSITSLTIDSKKLQVDKTSTLTLVVAKSGTGTIADVDIVAYIGGTTTSVYSTTEDFNNATDTYTIDFTPSVAHEGMKDITVVIDPTGQVNDPNTDNNEKTVTTDAVKPAEGGDDDDDDDDDSLVPAFTFTVIALVSVAFFVSRRRR